MQATPELLSEAGDVTASANTHAPISVDHGFDSLALAMQQHHLHPPIVNTLSSQVPMNNITMPLQLEVQIEVQITDSLQINVYAPRNAIPPSLLDGVISTDEGIPYLEVPQPPLAPQPSFWQSEQFLVHDMPRQDLSSTNPYSQNWTKQPEALMEGGYSSAQAFNKPEANGINHTSSHWAPGTLTGQAECPSQLYFQPNLFMPTNNSSGPDYESADLLPAQRMRDEEW